MKKKSYLCTPNCVIMCSLECLKVDLKGLKDDETSLVFNLDDSFFGALDEAEVKKGSLHVSVSIRKATGFYELLFHTVGTVTIPCDRCLDDMQQPIVADLRLVATLGREETPDEDDVIVVDEHEGVLDTAWPLYESIALAVPIQHVHQPGDCNDAMMRKLKELSAARSSDADAQATDPRWDALLKLKETDNKK